MAYFVSASPTTTGLCALFIASKLMRIHQVMAKSVSHRLPSLSQHPPAVGAHLW